MSYVDPVDPITEGLISSAINGVARTAMGSADHRFTKTGRVRCALRVVDGRQAGLSGQWRRGEAVLSRGRLEFRPRRQRAFGISVLAVHRPPRIPSSGEILKLPGPIVRIQTTAGTLEWAVNVRYGPDAIARLGVEYVDPDPT